MANNNNNFNTPHEEEKLDSNESNKNIGPKKDGPKNPRNNNENRSLNKRGSRGHNRKDPGKFKGDKKGAKQDPYWYAKDENAVKSFASLPFVEISGSPITDADYTANPAILVVPFIPTIPGTTPRFQNTIDTDTFATKAANAYYQSVAQGFSASFDFEAPDLLFTAIAGADLMALMLEAPRALSAAKKFVQNNSQWAEKVVAALGFNYSSIKNDYLEWISAYNIRAEQFNRLIAVPKNFFLGDRWAHLSSNIFSELKEWDSYSTAFAYKHRYRIQYDGTSATTGTCLVYREVLPPTTGFTYQSFFNMIDTMMNALTGDDQRAMFGAIRRVYDDASLLKINQLALGEVNYDIVYNEVQALQLHNSTFAAKFGSITPEPIGELLSAAAYQTAGGAILSNPYVQLADNFAAPLDIDQHIVSLCGSDDTSPGTVLDITANILPTWNEQAEENPDYQYCSPRSEVLLYPEVYLANTDETVKIPGFIDKAVTFSSDDRVAVTILSRMDRAPLVYLYDNLGKPIDCIGEIDRYSVVTREFLARLNSKCAYNMLALPLANSKLTKR